MASKKISQLPLNTSSLPTNAVIITNIGGVTYQSPLSTLGDPSPYKFYDANNYSIIPKIGNNSASGYGSNVAGGYGNSASGYYSNVASGYCNIVSGYYSNVAGGFCNIADGGFSNVAGGWGNTASGFYSNVAGGRANTASGYYSNVAGGYGNNTNNQCNTFILGSNITASQPNYTYVNNLSSQNSINASIISSTSGNSNQWNSVYNSVLSNSANNASINYVNANYLPLSGGTITGSINVLSGLEAGNGSLTLEVTQNNVSVYGILSSNSAIYDFVGNSNQWNSVYTSWNSVSATSVVSYNDTRFSKLSSQAYTLVYPTNSIKPTNGSNTASGCYSNIAGGRYNITSKNYSNVAGGVSNIVSGGYSNVGGGISNTASGNYSNVAGGICNTASAYYSNVAGGTGNSASGYFSNIAGGRNNTACGDYSNVGGGWGNTASGFYSSILGGYGNNTNNQCNTFILGSNITASQPNYTYVNNLSSQNSINASIISSTSGNSNQWNFAYSNQTNFLPLSGGSMTGSLTVVGNISATQNYFSGTNKSVFTPQTTTVGVSAISNIVAVSVLPVTPDPSTLYIVI